MRVLISGRSQRNSSVAQLAEALNSVLNLPGQLLQSILPQCPSQSVPEAEKFGAFSFINLLAGSAANDKGQLSTC